MKVKVVKPGTLVWDAEQGVVVQDKPVQVRATGAIRDALNSKQIVEVFDDEENVTDNSISGSGASEVEATEPEVEAVTEAKSPKKLAVK